MKDLSLPLLMAMISFASAVVVGIFTTFLKWYLERQAKAADAVEVSRQTELKNLVRSEVASARGELLEKFTAQNAKLEAAVTHLGAEAGKDRLEMKRVVGSILKWQKLFEGRFTRLEEKSQETRVLVERIKGKA